MSTVVEKNIITFPFTESFIENLADYIVCHFPADTTDFSRLAICFGGKRPALFLKRALARRIKADFKSPRFFTIDEFVQYSLIKKEHFTSIQDLDSSYLMYTLAHTHAPEILKGRASFAEFLPWSREILRFIDQLDLEHVDNNKLMNVKANAQIGYNVPDDINQLLTHIVTLREKYHDAMLVSQDYARGFQYFRAAENIQEVGFDEFDNILFCNFFYFNTSEETVVKHLFDQKKATLIFQGDSRKWPVLKRTAKRFNIDICEGDKPKPTHFNLKLHKGFDAHSQIGLVRDILKNVKNPEDTVVVLPNPDHIIPLLSEVSHITQDFNISMGYPLKRSSLFALIQLLFQTHLSFENGRYYAKDYLKTIRHPFIKNLSLSEDAAVTRILIHKIEEILTGQERSSISGSLFLTLDEIEECEELFVVTQEMLVRLKIEVSLDEIKRVLHEIHDNLFLEWQKIDSFAQFADKLTALLDVLIDKSFMHRYPLNLNIAHKITHILDEFRHAAFTNERFAQEDIFRIFAGKIDREIVAFVGSPLKGLQMLGLFETRALNFENVIVLDTNEGVLPHLSMYEPLVPREVMIGLNLDRMELEEEIQRYQFMRLISSAKNVHLVYQQSKDKERSRFIEELIWEEEKKKEVLDVIHPTTAAFKVNIDVRPTEVKKTPEIIEFLHNHRFSASSIKTYLMNPMDFYYSYCLGLREKEDLLDEPDVRHVGTFIHELLEDQFTPFLNKKPVIDNDFRHIFYAAFERKFADTFGRTMKSDAFLLKAVISERLKVFLDKEEHSEERHVDEILCLEKRFVGEIPLSCGPVKFGCIIDRIDRMEDGSIMILDYKTGSSDIMPQNIERIENLELSRESISSYIKSFQLPLYYYFLNEQYPNDRINAALYNLRSFEISKLVKKMDRTPAQINEVYLKALDYIMSEILDPTIPFIDDPK